LITGNKIYLFPAIARRVNSSAVNISKYVVGKSTLRNTCLAASVGIWVSYRDVDSTEQCRSKCTFV